jgi:2-dehydro-3-deoxyglucarate aldolase/4-hydroxy-2-oxoheptanedioate aldolase
VETPVAVTNLDGILAVDGVNGIFIGPMDLATNMGHLGNPGHPQVQETIAQIEKKVLASQKALSTLAGNWEKAQQLFAKGYTMVTLMADGTSLAKLAADRVTQFRNTYPGG